MRRLVLGLCGLLLVSGVAFAASPLVTAWLIREAVRTGDAAYLEHRIDWPAVKETLKVSLTRYALKQPEPDAETTEPSRKPGLWQRFKSYLGTRAVDKLVDNYATPTGLPQLFTYGRTYRTAIKGEVDEAATAPLTERMRRFWSRVKRAEFKSLSEFEIELADKHDPERHYVGLLRLDGLGWKLVELHVQGPRPTGTLADAWSGLESAAVPR
ncbi:MAG: DUF2939 domain-containing protein [Pseudomonadota bacterium]